MKNYYNFLLENKKPNTWYRGFTTKTLDNEYFWLSSDKKHANGYADINFYVYGGEKKVEDYYINIGELNILNLCSYDMDETVNENEIDAFLTDVSVYFDYVDIFDMTEDTIPLSRLVNNILDDIINENEIDGFSIMEDNIKTIYINKNLVF